MPLFIIFGTIALTAGIGMILQRNAVHGALLLVLNFFAVSMLFLTLSAEFLMVAQIIVYAGAIMVLFLFVIMLLGVDRSEDITQPRQFQVRQLLLGVPIAAVVLFALFSGLVTPVLTEGFAPPAEGFGSVEALGRSLFDTYLVPFEVTSLLLLVAAVGILMLARRPQPNDADGAVQDAPAAADPDEQAAAMAPPDGTN